MMNLTVVFCVTVATLSMIDAIPIGIIQNVSLIIIPEENITSYASSCNECLCTMHYSNSDDPILSFNCHPVPANQVACQMFPSSAYNRSYRHHLEVDANSIFYFQQLPTESQFAVTTLTATYTTPMSRPIVIITRAGDSIVGLYNTTAGGPTGAKNGRYSGTAEEPPQAIDNNVNTKYLNFGSTGWFGVTASAPGVGTGFYVTPTIRNASIAIALRFATADDEPDRDPLTVTLEGTNFTSLDLASSWSLIYNGSTGIDPTADPGRRIFVPQQNFSNTIVYRSYRLLITSQRSAAWAVQYAEAQIIGYA